MRSRRESAESTPRSAWLVRNARQEAGPRKVSRAVPGGLCSIVCSIFGCGSFRSGHAATLKLIANVQGHDSPRIRQKFLSAHRLGVRIAL